MLLSTLSQVSANDTSTATQGWTASSNDRGTLDIIWGCFFTIFLCGWSTICVNVPSQRSTWAVRFGRKCLVFCEALAGPEFIFHTALGQYMTARQSIQDFASAGFHGWTIQHGFFADMGGFVLHSPDFVPFPLNVSQVHYLVAHRFVDFQDVLLDKLDIEDRNKFDTLTRVLMSFQLLWFVINTVARVSLGMAISTLELSTIAFIFCTLFTCFFWRLKPQDVSAPIAIELKVPLAAVLTGAGAGGIASRPYSYTPLDFANASPHWFELVWRYCFNIPSRAMGLDFHSRTRPVDKIWDDRFSHLGLWPSALLAFVQASFAAIHFAAWNFHFPSDVERQLWHVAASYIICSMLCTWIVIYGAFELLPWLAAPPLQGEQQQTTMQKRRIEAEKASSPSETRELPRLASALRLCLHRCNNSVDRNPSEDVPLLVVITMVPMCTFYIFARAYIIIEDILNLRELPSSVYGAVNWSAFIPHF